MLFFGKIQLMKKVLSLCVFIAFIITSCSKKEGTVDLPQPDQNTNPLSPVPNNFTKKVLIEELTASWCGYSPRGNHYVHTIDSIFGGKVIKVAIHVSDAMEDLQLVTPTGLNLLDSGLFHNFDTSDTGYPNSSVNRAAPLIDPAAWTTAVPGQIGVFAKCGLAIDASSLDGNSLTVSVHSGFAQSLNSDYRLNVYLVETNVHSLNIAYDQHNYYSQSAVHPNSSYIYYGSAAPVNYYHLPPSINDYRHDNVLRKLLTEVPFGDKIPVAEMAKGYDYVKTFTVSLAGYIKSNCYIVAFIDKYGTDFLNNEHQVQNVQRVKVGQIQYWD